jgi:uncharacterized membrane protein required for colicin V production
MQMDTSTTSGFFHSLVTRRLGLIVGCALGIFVFIVLISVLGWMKVKKRRIELAKRQQMPQEFVSYHSYSISQTDEQGNCNNNSANSHHQNHIVKDTSKEALVSNLANCQHHHMHNSHGHPNYISGTIIGTTTIPM